METQGLTRSDAEYRRFEDMMNLTRRRAYGMALQLTRNAGDAEDLLQDTMIKAWKGFESYVPGRPFLNWLLRIMQRAYLDTLRRENPIRKADSLNTLVNPADGEVQELPIADTAPQPDEIAILEEFNKEFYAAMEELPDVYRKAIVMCDIQGLNYSEIADAQETTIGTVRSRIHRGRKFLREIAIRRNLKLPRTATQ